MLKSCVCLGRNRRRGSSTEDSSSCRSSDIERAGANMETLTVDPNNVDAVIEVVPDRNRRPGSIIQLLQSRSWYRNWRKPVRGMSMTKCEITIKAVLLIQAWYRRHLSRMEIRRRTTWTIFQRLELASEQDQFELYRFFNALLTHMPGAQGKSEETSKASDEQNNAKNDDDNLVFKDNELAKSYSTTSINFPLDKPEIDKMIELFRKHKKVLLHPKHVINILKEAAIRLQRLQNFNTASTALSKQVTVCGDLHGNLDDLLVIFYKNGLPSTNNPYVFNGDFVDRGKRGLEVFLLLLSCFLAFPNSVFLNRGNHEDSVMNARYGFTNEVERKYGQINGPKILKRIDEVYRWLPLGTIVNNRVLIVHGGISDATDLDLLKSLDRGKYVSILRPPVGEGGERVDKSEWKQIFDIMWSDPQHNDGCIPNTLRGAGTYFGPDVTDSFLKRHKLDLLIRSHECKPDGHEFCHDSKVITIFSASNYYAIGSNRGAYLKLNPKLQTQFFKYISEASKTRQMTFHQRVGIIESAALKELGVRLRTQRPVLEAEFQKHDVDDTGFIPIGKWSEALETATSLGLPWRLLREKLAPTPGEVEGSKPPKLVNYKTTLNILDSEIIMEAYKLNTSVADSLYKNISSLETIFHILDKDNSGFISLDEFSEACDLLETYLPGSGSKAGMLHTCRLMDLNKDGVVDLNEFLEAFRLSDQKRSGITPENEEDLGVTLVVALPDGGEGADGEELEGAVGGAIANGEDLEGAVGGVVTATIETTVQNGTAEELEGAVGGAIDESAAPVKAKVLPKTAPLANETDEDIDAIVEDEYFDPSDHDLRLTPGECLHKN